MLIQAVQIENYKSIQSLELELGRVTVLIGENGCGKTNILEALGLMGACASLKLENEFLSSRGVRVTSPQFMRNAAKDSLQQESINLGFEADDSDGFIKVAITHSGEPFSSWTIISPSEEDRLKETAERLLALGSVDSLNIDTVIAAMSQPLDTWVTRVRNHPQWELLARPGSFSHLFLFSHFFSQSPQMDPSTLLRLREFALYAPENSSLRVFEQEGQLEPLGIRGEGLLKLLRVMSENEPDAFAQIKEKLAFVDWFDDFQLPNEGGIGVESRLYIKDRFLAEGTLFDQRSANEGFLFLLFYMALFSSKETPSFFAVDNIDVSLNPKLCRQLMKELVEMAKANDKQVVLTTHNPAILDGLDLHDEEQKLYVVSRSKTGATKVKRVNKAEPLPGQAPVPLSEAFLRGLLGGLPKHF